MKTKSQSATVAQVLTLMKSRRWVNQEEVITFKDLYREESRKISRTANPDHDLDEVRVATGPGGEPWVKFTPQDRFGLALSGGGIRSGTFNLGLLQSLDELGVLKHVDYLATVSGGGYVGGFWTAWLQRNKERQDMTATGGKKFPRSIGSETTESAEIRHLREFSRFLLPNVRVLGTEFWNIIMTVLGGVLPSLAAALAVLVLFWFGWVSVLGVMLAVHSYVWRAYAMLTFVCLYFIISEIVWQIPKRKSSLSTFSSNADGSNFAGYVIGAAIGAAAMSTGWQFWRLWMISPDMTHLRFLFMLKAEGFNTLKRANAGIYPVVLFTSSAMMLLMLRALIARFCNISFLLGFERAATRMLRLAGIMLGFAALWWLADQIANDFLSHGWSGRLLPSTGAGTALSTGLFLWARKWLSEPPKETHGGNLLWLAFGWLKRATPKVLATLTWLLLFLLVGVVVECWLQTQGTPRMGGFWWLPGSSVALVALMIVLYDPERMGLHELYRARIARCYLGASNPRNNRGRTEAARARRNRSTSEHPEDDLRLKDLNSISNPVHLICATANDLSGEPVGTLYRGAKSAVLSVHGISLGNQTAKLDHLRVSSALTASAAAFNSQMGRYSMDLGPAVTFLMTAFNLRLGLWVPHPENSLRWKYSLPGRFFFYELLGLSRADGKNLLLSDGGHFENFGLYELIRRHCRYIIASDCGADPEVAFDDLANVLRRVREDFGVEVELDVSRLSPGENQFAKQHAAIGTIHYNGLGGMDKGTLIFIKPAITGDEPPDVLQYRTRNRAFPHESTANQFYDEPQWESYRRLGAHSGRVVFEFLDSPERASSTVDNIFRHARSVWYALPDNLGDRLIEMTARCAELGQALSTGGPLRLRYEFFPETMELAQAPATGSPSNLAAAPEPDEELKVMETLIGVIQLMENVWVSGNFERYWSHPLNEGWMNYFHRWAGTPSFRRWWPVLAPIYSLGFRNFVRERFTVGSVDSGDRTARWPAPVAAQLRLIELGADESYQNSNAWRCLQQSRSNLFADLARKKILGYRLQLLGRDGVPETTGLWVGFMLIHESSHRPLAIWHADDFFVPQMLHGGNIVSNLLDAIIRHYQEEPQKRFHQLQVNFGPKPPPNADTEMFCHPRPTHKSQGLAAAARYERVRQIEFYKSRGFHYHEPEDADTGVVSLHLELSKKALT